MQENGISTAPDSQPTDQLVSAPPTGGHPDHLFGITFTESKVQKRRYTTVHNASFNKLFRALAEARHPVGAKDGQGFILAIFNAGSRLEGKNVERVTGVALDFDGKTNAGGKIIVEQLSMETILGSIGFSALAYTSFSHTIEYPRFRVVLPLREPILPEQQPRLWWWLYELTGCKADPSCKNPDRMFYLPRSASNEVRASGVHQVRRIDGPVLSLDAVPAAFKIPASSVRNTRRQATGAGERPPAQRTLKEARLLLRVMAASPLVVWATANPDDVSREVWRGIAANLWAAVEGHPNLVEFARAMFHEISSDYHLYREAETEKVFDEAAVSLRVAGPMLYSTMIAAGAPPEVCIGGSALIVAAQRAAKCI